MKKTFIILGTMASSFAFSQIGINTTTPVSSLDVTAKNATGTTTNVDGLLVPRVDRQRAQSMTGTPVSTLIYVNSIATGSAAGTAINIDETGYYYFDGTAWTKLKTPAGVLATTIYNADGSLSGNRTVTQNANTLTFTGTSVNSFSVDGNTFSVDAANNRVGIGTISPGTSAKLQVDATNQGMLIPRVTLTSSTDAATILSPAKGLMVYNTNTNTSIGEGFFVNYGTPISPNWRSFENSISWTLKDFYDITATSPVNQTVSSTGTVNNIDLGMSITVIIPAFTEAKLVTTYNVPVGTTVQGSGITGGYFGVRFLKNGNEFAAGSRKYSIPAEASGVASRMVSVGNSVGDLITNNTASSVSVTYTLNGYIEANVSSSSNVRFNMWVSSGTNFNWGRSYMKAELYTRPL